LVTWCHANCVVGRWICTTQHRRRQSWTRKTKSHIFVKHYYYSESSKGGPAPSYNPQPPINLTRPTQLKTESSLAASASSWSVKSVKVPTDA
jgi:hypothetical protein